MLLRAQFRALVAAQLRAAATAAGANVYEGRQLPVSVEKLPVIVLSTPREHKASTTRGAPKFNTVIELVVSARVSGATDDAVEAALEHLVEQIEFAILCNPSVVSRVQQFVTVETQTTLSAEGGRRIGDATIVFQPEIYQVYDPATPTRLTRIEAAMDANGDGKPDVTIAFPLPA